MILLGHPPNLISVHFVTKGSNVHAETERRRINEYNAHFVISVDQGSRAGPPLADGENVRSMVIDHHWSEQFPENALVILLPIYAGNILSVISTGSLSSKVPARSNLECTRIYALQRNPASLEIGTESAPSVRTSLYYRYNRRPGFDIPV